jgi:hypothetical protein
MLKANACTLYSGGYQGTETYFGECAERWGVKEVTFSYAGHAIKRQKNVVMLDEKELLRGDVSMEIVSLHMHRQYSQSDKIRSVLQLTFHMVNKGLQIFAVGTIQDDKTVMGGTGWGVELGKFLNRDLHVFDKKTNAWYTWRAGEWVRDIPVISETTFCATGTRELTVESLKAIEDLFIRSFVANQ